MKRFTQLIFLLMALLLPATALAYDFEVNGIYYTINGTEAMVAQSPSYEYEGTVIIPLSVTYNGTTYSVTAIDDKAFYKCHNLTNVTVPNSVTSIGNHAFIECSPLEGVNIPNAVASIGRSAFYGCSSLTSITLPSAITSIGTYTFGNCTSLTSINIPSLVTAIGTNAFLSCTSLQRVDIDDVAAWCNISFDGIQANPLNAAHHLYLNGSEVTNLVVPSSVTVIKDFVFYGCHSMTKATLSNSVTSIGTMAFAECRNMTSITLSNSLTTINYGAFSECNSLKSVTLPKSVTNLGEWVFDGTTAMTSMAVESGNPVYDSRNNCNAIIETATNTLIEGCKNTVIPNTVTTIAGGAFSYRYELTSITIPNSVTTIKSAAFVGCYALTSIHIPSSVTSIQGAPFQDCPQLVSMTVASGNPVYDSRNNCNAIVETATNKLVAGCKATVIPSTVTAIGNNAFYYCSGLTSIRIPNSVTAIGNWAFEECSSLSDVYTDITDPTAITMGDEVFSGYVDYSYTGRTLHVPKGSLAAYQADTKWSNYFEFIVEMGNIGDANGDGFIDISDVTDLIDYLLGVDVPGFDTANADLDGDGEISIGDVSALIDFLLMQ